jgi:YD repeat-containing protein
VADPLGRVTSTAYDPEDRPTVVTQPPVGAQTEITTTTYDVEGQATQVADPLDQVTTTAYSSRGWVQTTTDPRNAVTTYSYTANGLTATESITLGASFHEVLASYSYDKDDRLVAAEDSNSNVTQTLYDAVGNVTATIDGNNNPTDYAYDYRNRLTGATVRAAGGTIANQATYTYDALDRRIGMNVNATLRIAVVMTCFLAGGYRGPPPPDPAADGLPTSA